MVVFCAHRRYRPCIFHSPKIVWYPYYTAYNLIKVSRRFRKAWRSTNEKSS